MSTEPIKAADEQPPHPPRSARSLLFRRKLSKILLELLIIIFGVSVSIWLNNWSKHYQEQKLVRIFLLGLKKDLQADRQDTEACIQFFEERSLMYSYLNKMDPGRAPSLDTLSSLTAGLGSNSFLRPHQTRFNGFLSAGKIMDIQQDSLVQQILKYYQETIPQLKSSESAWISYHELLKTYLMDNGVQPDDPMRHYEVLITPKGRHLTQKLIPWSQFFERYRKVHTSAGEIIAAIDALYPEER